jgi:hypothetical protein
MEKLTAFWAAPDEALFDERVIAAVFGCSTATLERDRWQKRGLPYLKHGRNIRYRKGDIVTHINANRVEHPVVDALPCG